MRGTINHTNTTTSSPSKTPLYMISSLLVAVSLTSKTSAKECKSTPNLRCQGRVMCMNLTQGCTQCPATSSLGLGTYVRFNTNKGLEDSLMAWMIWALWDSELHRTILSIMMLVVRRKHLSTWEVRLGNGGWLNCNGVWIILIIKTFIFIFY
jgi:hypothetical protein